MKKNNYILFVLSVIGTLLFGIGMCMCLLTEWQLGNMGLILGILGLITYVITYFTYRHLENKAPIVISFKKVIVGLGMLVAIFIFGYGLVLTMVNHNLPLGIFIGCIGILLCVGLLPFMIKIKKA